MTSARVDPVGDDTIVGMKSVLNLQGAVSTMAKSLRTPILSAALAIMLLGLGVHPAQAQPAGNCAIGPGTGASLVFPYFEVDLANANSLTTLISINNGGGSPVLARVVLWTDWGVPTLAFDVYLTPTDVQTINVNSLFNGNIPSTGEGVDLSDLEFCELFPPSHDNPILTDEEQGQLSADHRGVSGPIFTDCAGQTYGDGIARGYITVDVVDECSGVESANEGPIFTPDNITWPYFSDDPMVNAIGTNDNVLWGDSIIVDFQGNAAQGSEAIALWANGDLFDTTGIYTFYGGYSGFDGRDDRVPLPTVWNQRFLNGGVFGGGADILAFRPLEQAPAFAACGSTPSWYPFTSGIDTFDEDADNGLRLADDLFPAVTQRVSVDDFGIPYDFGFVQVGDGADQEQMWVQPSLTAGGLFSSQFNGSPIAFLCDAIPPMAVTAAPSGVTTERAQRTRRQPAQVSPKVAARAKQLAAQGQ